MTSKMCCFCRGPESDHMPGINEEFPRVRLDHSRGVHAQGYTLVERSAYTYHSYLLASYQISKTC